MLRIAVILFLACLSFNASAEHGGAMRPRDKRPTAPRKGGVEALESMTILFVGGSANITNVRKVGKDIVADVEVAYPLLKKYTDVKFRPGLFSVPTAEVGGIRIELNSAFGIVTKPQVYGGLLGLTELRVVTYVPLFK